MNNRRLHALKDAVGRLQTNTAPCTDTTLEEFEKLREGHEPPLPDVLEMSVVHGTSHGRKAACIAGTAIALYQKKSREIIRRPPRPGLPRPPALVAAELLSLSRTEAWSLFYARGSENRWNEPITPAQASLAIHRLMTGTALNELWKTDKPATPPECEG